MNNQALKYYMHDGPSAFRFELEGQLTDESARRLEQDWITASSVMAGRTLIVDMTFVTAADAAGRELLGRWHASGARLVAASKTSRSLAESIIGRKLPEYSAPRGQTIAEPTWLPFRSFSEGTPSGVRRLALPYRGMTVRDKVTLPNWTPSKRHSHTVVFAMLLLLFPANVNGANVKRHGSNGVPVMAAPAFACVADGAGPRRLAISDAPRRELRRAR
jgi:hypothetical protein